jgi:linoleoyl-CoA desaturase
LRLPSADRVEPWRDWALLVLLNQGLLLFVAVVQPAWPWLLLIAIPLGMGLANATLTVLHDAGHRRLSRNYWVNVFATQTAAPVGLWVEHWTLKHRVHHRVTQVYPLDDATRSSGMIRLHPSAPRKAVHRYQQHYAWFLYGLAWLGELRSQITWVQTGELAGVDSPPRSERLRSFLTEKALCGLILVPYAIAIGPVKLAFLLVVSMTFGSAFAAVVLVVGHINSGLTPTDEAPEGRDAWAAHLIRTSASFSTDKPFTRWLTGGMTHHLAHHLRATASRGEFPELHRTTVAEVVEKTGVPMTEYPTLWSAVIGHRRALAELGRAEHVPRLEVTHDGRDPSELVLAGAAPPSVAAPETA